MNKNIKILLIVLIAALAVFFLVVNKPWTTLKAELKDFDIKDTTQITKVFLAKKAGNTVLLEKQPDNSWLVNGTYKADITKINLLKATMKQIQVRNPLSESEFNSVVAAMAAHATKVEFYNEKKLLKTIYVGSQTPDQTGTFMMIEGSSTPFVTHIAGFVGYLTPRFSTDYIRWKSKEIFVLPADEIAEIKVDYPQQLNESFVIDNTSQEPVLKNTKNETVKTEIPFLKYYLGMFGNLYFEGYVEDVKPVQNDSIRATPVFCTIEVKQKNTEQTHRLQVYQKGVNRRSLQQYDEEGNKLDIDPDKYLAYVNDDENVVYIQEYVFGKVFKQLSEFKNIK